jgi:hypothetical protein
MTHIIEVVTANWDQIITIAAGVALGGAVTGGLWFVAYVVFAIINAMITIRTAP